MTDELPVGAIPCGALVDRIYCGDNQAIDNNAGLAPQCDIYRRTNGCPRNVPFPPTKDYTYPDPVEPVMFPGPSSTNSLLKELKERRDSENVR